MHLGDGDAAETWKERQGCGNDNVRSKFPTSSDRQVDRGRNFAVKEYLLLIEERSPP